MTHTNLTRAQRELLMEAHELATIAKARAKEATLAARKAAARAHESAEALNRLMHGEGAVEPLTIARLADKLSGDVMPRWVERSLAGVQDSAALALVQASSARQTWPREAVLQSLTRLPFSALHELALQAVREGVTS